MIRLADFLETPDPSKTKVKFNMHAARTPAWDLLLDDDPRWLEMNEWRTKQSNNNLDAAEYVHSFAQFYPYGPEYFIYGGLFRVEKMEQEIVDGPGYKLELLNENRAFIKRLIIKNEKPIGRDLYLRWFDGVQSQLNPEVYELAPRTKLGPFMGYQNVSLSHQELRRIVRREEPAWKQALSHVKAVYVITDRSDGKLYVGSASGEAGGLWQRWSDYANERNQTGGNSEFIELKTIAGNEHIEQNFQYSILEIFDTKVGIDEIVERESYWKRVLMTRKPFGMNLN